jgi:THO complex subunit 2
MCTRTRVFIAVSIVEQLCKPEKQKLKASDAALSPWLISLSTFVAHAYKRYNMELTCVLQYIANELKDGNSYDLLILRDIVLMMSGVETSTGMTQELIQVCASLLVFRSAFTYRRHRVGRR